MARKPEALEIEGRKVAVSNLDKVLYPGAGFTKGQVIDYYVHVSRLILPHLKNRPITLVRFPDGVRGKYFYEKNAPKFTPEWVQRFGVPRHAREGEIQYILINDLASLVWAANLASLELHPFLHRVPKITCPTEMVFDLDPGEGADVLTCARVAVLLRDVCAEMKLKSFPKVSGSKGMQLYVPLNSGADYEVVTPFARMMAERMEERHPELVVSKMAKELRAGKVFIDWSQNSETKTTVSVYSLRAKAETPYVSMPVTWEELEKAGKSKKREALRFEPDAALKRLEKVGDLFGKVENLRQKLPADILKSARKLAKPRSGDSAVPADEKEREPTRRRRG